MNNAFHYVWISLVICFTAGGIASAAQRNDEAIEAVRSGERTDANAAWWGFDANDATAALQSAIDSGAETVRIPNMGTPWNVGPIALQGDQKIVFEKGVVVQAKAGLFKDPRDCLFTAREQDGITLEGYGATIRMRREDYIDSEQYEQSEWRHAISLLGCEDVQILGLTIKDSGGDGIYLGRVHPRENTADHKHRSYCKDIVIRDVVCDGHHRQGISVISAENLLVEGCKLKNTQGTAPAAGIDLEPNFFDERMVNIHIRDSEFAGNRRGMMLFLKDLENSPHEVSVLWENCRVLSGNVAVDVVGVRDGGPGGTIRFKNCVIRDGVTRVRDKSADGAEVIFENCSFRNGTVPISMHAQYGYTDRLGGVRFIDCTVAGPEDGPMFQAVKHHESTRLVDVHGSLRRMGARGSTEAAARIELPVTDVTLEIDGQSVADGTVGE